MVAPLDAEYSVIGSLLLEPQIAGELFAATSEQDFTREELRNVYLAARKIFNAGKPLDAVTLRAAVGKEYEPLFFDCMEVTLTGRRWKAYVAAMQEQTRVTRLHELADRLAQIQTSEEGRELIAQASAAAGERSGV